MLTHALTLQEKLDIYKNGLTGLIEYYVEDDQVSGICSVLYVKNGVNVTFSIIDNLEEFQSCRPENVYSGYWWKLDDEGFLIRTIVLEWCIESVKRQIRNENRKAARALAQS